MNVDPQLAPEEQLSPELVLVLPPELRAEAIARLGSPAWPTPPRRVPETAAPFEKPAPRPRLDTPVAHEEPFARSLAVLVGARLVQLGVIFIVVTIAVLALSLVAQAFH